MAVKQMRDPGGQGPARSRWFSLLWIIPSALVAFALIVLLARWLREIPAVESFIDDYSGDTALPGFTPVGMPAWLSWTHFLNVFFLVLIVRSGWQLRSGKRPPAFWTRNNTGLIRTKKRPRRLSITLWFHLSLDALWIVNGIVYYVLLFSTGHWARLVPLHWDVFPNALSVGIQYLSLNWPVETGWTEYNSLQMLTYFITVFVAAPLAIVSGLRMSPLWPQTANRLNRAYPERLARAIHYPTMLWFVLFVIVHVTLVLATGALNNLNHMYAGRNDNSWIGFVVFAVSIVVIAAAWVAARPVTLRAIASLSGKVTR